MGLMMLVYFCATNFQNLKVINGNGKGTKLDEIDKIDVKTVYGLSGNEVFLDNATGDYYSFRKDIESWAP